MPRGSGQPRGTCSEFSPKALGEARRGEGSVCARICACVSVCGCKVGKAVRLPRGRHEGTSRIFSVGGGDWVPKTLGAELGRDWMEDHSSLARSLQTVLFCFVFFLFRFFSLSLRLVAHAISRCRLCPGMQFGSEYSSRCGDFPIPAKRANPGGHGTRARPDQFYANERSLGEDLPRGGGSGVTCQFRGRNGHFARFRDSVLSLAFAVEEKVQLSGESQ